VNKPVIELITFDVDQTLSDFNAVLKRALRASAEVLNPHLPQPIAPDALQRLREAILHRPRHQNMPMLELRRMSFVEVLGSHPNRVAIADQAIEAFTDIRFNHITLMPGARALIDNLYGRVALGWITNGNSRPVHLGMCGRFAVTALAEDLGMRKPSVTMFHHVLHAAGNIRPDRWIHIGDHIHTDVQGAKRAGGRAIWLDHGTAPPDPTVHPDHVICKLDDLYPILGQYDLQSVQPKMVE
jgi:putative hydrolase of the HAD superfamily